jgi:hypothetical protein
MPAARRGPVVPASDVAHHYENFMAYRPLVIVHDLEATLGGHDRLRDLTPGTAHIVPGHGIRSSWNDIPRRAPLAPE